MKEYTVGHHNCNWCNYKGTGSCGAAAVQQKDITELSNDY
jgi:hypothetical protein